MERAEALTLLKAYSCLEPKFPRTPEERSQLQRAIAWLCGESEGENLGICAGDQGTAETALRQYLQALDYGEPLPTNLEPVAGPVYLKCNTQSLRFYVDSYAGEYRGVLIACQSEDDDEVNGTYGHFPLDLFSSVYEV